jgi:hypothetical protein
MPDEPGKGPPPSTPLSVEAADRLAENFTSIWDVDGESVPALVPAAPIAVSKPVTRHITLPGINPLDFGDPAPSVTPPSASVAPVALPVAPPFVAPKLEPTPGTAVTQPMPADSAAPATPATQSEVHAPASLGASNPEALTGSVDPAASPSPSPSPTRQVPGYAIAYTPKDGPGTPAVVIAPEAQSSPEHARPFSLTIPARGRAVEAAPPAAPIAVPDLDSFPPPKKGSGKRISALVAGAILLVAGILLGVRALSGSGAPGRGDAPPASPTHAAAESVLPVPPLSPTPASDLLTQPQATEMRPSASPAKSAPVPTDPKAARTLTESKKISTATELKKSTPARTKAAPVAGSPIRPASRPVSATPLPPSSPGAASKPAPAKAVIVRDTPF